MCHVIRYVGYQGCPKTTDAAQESAGATKPLNPTGVKAMQGGDVTAAQPIPPPDALPPPGDWVDRGIVDVPVADLPDPEGVKDAGDFEKVSAEDIEGRPIAASRDETGDRYRRGCLDRPLARLPIASEA